MYSNIHYILSQNTFEKFFFLKRISIREWPRFGIEFFSWPYDINCKSNYYQTSNEMNHNNTLVLIYLLCSRSLTTRKRTVLIESNHNGQTTLTVRCQMMKWTHWIFLVWNNFAPAPPQLWVRRCSTALRGRVSHFTLLSGPHWGRSAAFISSDIGYWLLIGSHGDGGCSGAFDRRGSLVWCIIPWHYVPLAIGNFTLEAVCVIFNTIFFFASIICYSFSSKILIVCLPSSKILIGYYYRDAPLINLMPTLG
jgi:hypothetical protein